MFDHLAGVYAASVTPLKPDFTIALDDVIPLLDFLASRGCHGALLFGTTGEGPSFSPAERLSLLREAIKFRNSRPDFRLLAGTGTPSLTETIELTNAAFDLEFDGVVVLPPYYFRAASSRGLFDWYSQVIENSIPSEGALFGYHIPSMSGMPLSIELLSRLKNAYPDRFAGIKDSSGDPNHARRLGQAFGSDMIVLSGNDRLFSLALRNSASGCITALANLRSPDLRRVWDAYQRGQSDETAQSRLNTSRSIMERYLPAPPLLKAILSRWYNFNHWAVKPPLTPLPPEVEAQSAAELKTAE